MKKILMIGGAVGLIVGGVLLIAGLARVGERPAKLTWRDPEIKSALMTLGYKVYGSPKVEFGRHYLSKLVFKNTGEHPVTDFSISYKIDDYIGWTDPEEIHEIPAGFTLVKLFHPRLPAQVTKIRNATNATFRIRVLWKEEGRPHEETFARDILLRGINELVSGDLPDSETRSWFDANNAAAFAVCMVTPNDPVVNLYTSEITKLAGGTTAGILGGGKEIVRLCRTVYDYMQATGLRYTGDSFVIQSVDNVTTGVQTVRMPRDVIQNNQGLCIELAILWSAILEHLGLDSTMIFIPGHVFVIAYSNQQKIPFEQGLPIECTAITLRAVEEPLLALKIRTEKTGAPVTFDEAVTLAKDEWDMATQKTGKFILVPVKELQAAGYVAPELADIDTDKLTETLAKRLPHAGEVLPANGGGFPNPDGGRAQPVAPVTAGMNTWRHPQGLVSVSFPTDFVSILQPGAPPFILASVGNPATSVSCDVMQITGTQDPAQAVNYVASVFAQMGAMIQVTGSTPMANGVVMINGLTTSGMGGVRWTCLAKPVPGGVLLVSAGADVTVWAVRSAAIQAILSTVRFN
jgi:hypothetical protein